MLHKMSFLKDATSVQLGKRGDRLNATLKNKFECNSV